jgi:hypothetical protein
VEVEPIIDLTRRYIRGTQGVDATIAELQQAGYSRITKEVTVEAPGIGRTRVDLVATRPDGTLVAIEVKTGPTATLNSNQRWVLEALQAQGGGIPRGSNAAAAFQNGAVGDFQPMEVWVVYRP